MAWVAADCARTPRLARAAQGAMRSLFHHFTSRRAPSRPPGLEGPPAEETGDVLDHRDHLAARHPQARFHPLPPGGDLTRFDHVAGKAARRRQLSQFPAGRCTASHPPPAERSMITSAGKTSAVIGHLCGFVFTILSFFSVFRLLARCFASAEFPFSARGRQASRRDQRAARCMPVDHGGAAPLLAGRPCRGDPFRLPVSDQGPLGLGDRAEDEQMKRQEESAVASLKRRPSVRNSTVTPLPGNRARPRS